MIAAIAVHALLEDLPGDDDPGMEDVDRYMSTEPFDSGAKYILKDARDLYLQLVRDNSIPTLRKENPFMDDDSIAQAVLQGALVRVGSPGFKRAYRRLKKLSHYIEM